MNNKKIRLFDIFKSYTPELMNNGISKLKSPVLYALCLSIETYIDSKIIAERLRNKSEK